jgi:NAD+ synthase (glutamine-hydrolysing)
MEINRYGFLRVGAASPKLKVADCGYNAFEIKKLVERARQEEVQILCFPELCLTAYSCGDLFFQRALQAKAVETLSDLLLFMKRDENGVFPIVLVGLPLLIKNNLYNVAATISPEGILGVVPKRFLPSPDEAYGNRYFTPGNHIDCRTVKIAGKEVPLSSSGMIFRTPFGNFGVEIGEDLLGPVPPRRN